MVAKGPFMEFLRMDSDQSVINTIVEAAFITPTSRTEKMAMLIHMIETHIATPDAQDGVSAYTNFCVADEAGVGIQGIHHPHVLAYRLEEASFPLEEIHAGADSEYRPIVYSRHEHVLYFDPPLLCAKQYLYCTISSVDCLNVKDGAARIGYTLEKVSAEDFIAALTT